MQRIVSAVGGQQVKVYVVDPSPYESSGFASKLGITQEDYFCMGWGAFMRLLAQRVTEEQRAAIVLDCNELSKYWGTAPGDVAELCGRLSQIGLVGLGRLRFCLDVKQCLLYAVPQERVFTALLQSDFGSQNGGVFNWT